jgi:hypothetical protein
MYAQSVNKVLFCYLEEADWEFERKNAEFGRPSP